MDQKRMRPLRAVALAIALQASPFPALAESIILPSNTLSLSPSSGDFAPSRGVLEPSRGASFPVSAERLDWVPPQATDAPLLSGMPDGKGKKVVHYGAIALTAGGALLCAGGLATVASGMSDGMDSDAMHRGGIMIIAGAVSSAIFSVVARATASPR